MSQDIKNFYIYNTLFKHIININAITLIMKIIDYKNINKF